MAEEPTFRRRALLTTGVTLGSVLAGCSDSGSPARTDTDTADQTTDSGGTQTSQGSSSTETATAEAPSTTAEPSTAESAFAYPDGVTADGVDGEALGDTHRSTLSAAGAVTIERRNERRFDTDSFTTKSTRKLTTDAHWIETEFGDVTATEWSPTGADIGYVRPACHRNVPTRLIAIQTGGEIQD